MRSKNILSIVVFVAAFGLSAAFASLFVSQNSFAYNSTNCFKYQRNAVTANAIADLIARDHANGRIRSGKIYDIGESYPPSVNSIGFADYAEYIQTYVDASSAMNAENTPEDFQAAWHEHMKAWREYSDFLNRSADISGQTACSLRKFEAQDEGFNYEISRTWDEVLQSGRSYGANVR